LVSQPFFGNRLITAGIIAELAIILAINYTTAGQVIFGTSAIGVRVWLAVLPFAAGMVLLEEARKVIVRSRVTSRFPVRPAGEIARRV
jgi:hypothetical protein